MNDYLKSDDRFIYKSEKLKPYYPKWFAYILFIGGCLGMISFVSISYTLLEINFYITVYGGFVMIYYILQMFFAEMYRRFVYSKFKEKFPLDEYYKVGIQIVGYREDPELFKKCIENTTKINHKNKIIVVSIDGDTEKDEYMKTIANDILASSGIEYKILFNPHEGKRGALYHSYKYLRDKVDFVITTDSDSELPPDLCNLCVPMVEDPTVMVTCGEVFISNWETNFLTRILVPRYYVAFALERNCFSFFGVMNCASGPIGCYRASMLRHDYILETELRKQKYLWCDSCHVGDDRHMTVIGLQYGKCLSIPYIASKSDTPSDLHRFTVQQTRWAKSYHRETLLEVDSTRYHNFAYCFMIFFAYSFSFILLVYLILLLLARTPWWNLVVSVAIMVGVNFLRSLYLYFISRRKIMLLYVLYLPYYVFLILPIRLYTLFTHIDAKAWMTINSDDDLKKKKYLTWYRTYGHYFVIVTWDLTLLGLFGWWLYYQITV
jgi:hyaluronan synthase